MPIAGYEGLYEVDTGGNVWSFHRGGRKRITNHVGHSGYHRVCLSKNGQTRHIKVHRLVAAAFIENPENKKCINHKDGNPANNNLSNLEWVTHSENHLHAFRILGRKGSLLNKHGKEHPSSKPVIQYDLEGNYIAEYESCTDAGKATGCFARSIGQVALGRLKTTGGYKWKYALRGHGRG